MTLTPERRTRLLLRIRPAPGGCWRWTGRLDPQGYGRIGGRLAHRELYRELRGTICETCDLHHTCGNRACVRPDHLRELPRDEHAALRRSETCNRGHEIATLPSGRRQCRECDARRHRELKARRRMAA